MNAYANAPMETVCALGTIVLNKEKLGDRGMRGYGYISSRP